MPAASRRYSPSRRIGALTLRRAGSSVDSVGLGALQRRPPYAVRADVARRARRCEGRLGPRSGKGVGPRPNVFYEQRHWHHRGPSGRGEQRAHAEVILFGQKAYIYGDDNAVKTYFALSTTDPAKYANKWLSLTSTSSGFAAVSDAVTLQSDFQTVTIPGTLKEGSAVVLDGQKVVPIEGTIPATTSNSAIKATLYVSKSSPVLPAEFHLTSSSESFTVTWSKWGHAVTLAAPKTTHPIAKP